MWNVSGLLSVRENGMTKMLLWLADNLDSPVIDVSSLGGFKMYFSERAKLFSPLLSDSSGLSFPLLYCH